jgi:hypothetical protein
MIGIKTLDDDAALVAATTAPAVGIKTVARFFSTARSSAARVAGPTIPSALSDGSDF